MIPRTLLLNHVTWPAAGHAIEAIEISKSYAQANSDLEIHVMLDSRTAHQILEGCSWIKKVYLIDVGEVSKLGEGASCYDDIPRTWDFIISDGREGRLPVHKSHDKVIRKYKCQGRGEIFGKLPRNLLCTNTESAFIDVPQNNRNNVKVGRGLNICILPGSSMGEKYNISIESWCNIIAAVTDKYPTCNIYITGKTKGYSKTKAYQVSDIDNLAKQPNIHNHYNKELWDQVALFEACDLLIAPHTGFAFAAAYVNTPWLEIAAGDWSRYLFNNIAFYSVFPDDSEYPHQSHTADRDSWAITMSDVHISKKISEILEGMEFLLGGATYKTSKNLFIQKAIAAGIKYQKMGLDLLP
jgi:ADP-heptose:LPS heptosyltransferase